MLFFTLVGFFSRKLDFSFVTFLIGFVIGPNLELTFRQSIQLLNHNIFNLTKHPIAIVFIILTVVTIWWIGRANSRTAASARRNENAPADPINNETMPIQKGG